LVRPMVHSRKHYVQNTLATIGTGAKVRLNYVTSVEDTAANLANEVAEGSTVKAIYVELWAIGATLDQFFTAVVIKIPGGGTTPSLTDMANLNAMPNKKNVFYTTQGLASNDGVGNPIPLLRAWVKIPKSKQRMGLGDIIEFVIMSRGSDDIKICGFATYKEYT